MKKILVLSLGVGILLAALIFSGYQLILHQVLELSKEQIIVQAQHDESSLEASVERVWKELEGAGAFLNNPAMVKDRSYLLRHLHGLLEMLDCDELYLVSGDGMILKSNWTSGQNAQISALCQDGSEPFIQTVPGIVDYDLYLGAPVHVEDADGNIYTWLVVQMPMAFLQDQMKMDNFEGNGYSCLIRQDGGYVVSSGGAFHTVTKDNFFTFLKSVDMENGWSLNLVQQNMEHGKTFSLEGVRDDGPYMATFMPVQHTDWYFVLAIPATYFQAASEDFLNLLFVLTGGFVVLAALLLGAVFFERYRALRAAEQANKAKSIFLNNMSHDIRTPMNAVIGYTNLARAHLGDVRMVSGYLDKIGQSSEHLLALINDVLNMSRIEAGKVAIVPEPTDLEDLADGLFNMVDADALEKSLNFQVETELQNPYVLCDRVHLNQVLLNALSNGVKFSHPGGKVSLMIVQEGVQRYRFTVKDDGIGISPEFLDKIYEPFAREQSTTVSGVQGTGLGMAITKHLVDLMGGTIRIESAPGQGTVLSVWLDLPACDPVKKDAPEMHTEVQGMRVLLAEDNDFNREIATEILEDAGCKVDTAVNGREALGMVQKHPGRWKVILMDIQMPVMDGYEAAREIRKFCPDLPIVALSANVFEEDQQKAREAGMTAYLSKPLNIESLLRTLGRFK